MAYKFQLGAAVLSGSLVQEGDLEAQGSGEFTSLKIADDGAIGAIGDLDMITLDAGNDVTIASDLDLIVAEGKLMLGSTAITSTAAELNLLDGVSGLIKADFTKLAAVDASAAELNLLDAVARGSIIHGNASGASALLAKGNADTVLSSDGTDISYTAVSNAMLAGSIANSKLSNSTISGKALGTNLDALAVDDSSIEYSAGSAFNGSAASTIRIKEAGVTSDMLAGSVANAKLANSAVTITAGDGLKTGGSVALGGSVTLDIDASDFAGIGIDADGSENLNIAAAQTSITSIINSSMGKIGTDAAQEYIDFSTSNEIKFAVNNALVASVEDGAFVIAGDLRVNGTTTSVNSTTINISSSFTFEGPADDHETVLSSGSPSADSTLTLPTLSAGSYFIPALADAATDASAAVTAAEFALLDGGNSRGTDALADGDGFMHNDGGTMKQTNVLKMFEYTVAKVSGDVVIADTGAATIQAAAVEGSMLNDNAISGQAAALTSGLADTDEFLISDGGLIKRMDASVLKSYVSDAAADVQNVAAAGTLVVGINYFSDMSSDGEDAVALPASPSVGQSVKVKAPSDCSSARYITISRAGSQTIDGATSIRLESPFAAVELVYVANDLWRVF